MSGRLHKLKIALALANVAYAGYLLLQEEKQKKRSRKEAIKRKFERTRPSGYSSSDDNEVCEPRGKRRRAKIKEDKQSNEECDQRQKTTSASPFTADSFVSKLTESQFKGTFRISRITANQLFIRFKSSQVYNNIFMLNDQTRIPAKHYIWMFLWFVGRQCSYLELSNTFNVPLSKAVCVVDTILQFLNNSAPDLIRLPETPSELKDSADGFEQIAGFPDVIACVMSTEIQAKDSKKSIVAQVFCDSKGRFLDAFVDSNVNIHSTEVLEKSQMNRKLKNIYQGKYHALAKADQFSREWLLTPIDEPSSTEHIRYNQKHTKTMAVVSDSLDLLIQRFPQLINMHLFSFSKIKKMFIACCVLQNICLAEEDYFESEEVAEEDYFDSVEDRIRNHAGERNKKKPIDENTRLRKIGELKRRQIVAKLSL